MIRFGNDPRSYSFTRKKQQHCERESPGPYALLEKRQLTRATRNSPLDFHAPKRRIGLGERYANVPRFVTAPNNFSLSAASGFW